MNDDRELARLVAIVTGALVGAIALAGWSFGGIAEAAGALVGGAVTIADFLWLRWTAGLALRRTAAGGPLRRALWVGGSAARFGAVGLALGLAAASGRLGLIGLLVSLAALPVVVVTAGLRATPPAPSTG